MIRPTVYSLRPPRGNVRDGILTLFITGVDLEVDKVRLDIDQKVDHIDSYLTSLRMSAETLDSELASIACERIEAAS